MSAQFDEVLAKLSPEDRATVVQEVIDLREAAQRAAAAAIMARNASHGVGDQVKEVMDKKG